MTMMATMMEMMNMMPQMEMMITGIMFTFKLSLMFHDPTAPEYMFMIKLSFLLYCEAVTYQTENQDHICNSKSQNSNFPQSNRWSRPQSCFLE